MARSRTVKTAKLARAGAVGKRSVVKNAAPRWGELAGRDGGGLAVAQILPARPPPPLRGPPSPTGKEFRAAPLQHREISGRLLSPGACILPGIEGRRRTIGDRWEASVARRLHPSRKRREAPHDRR